MIVLTGGPLRKIDDGKGRIWLFEMHSYCGPMPLNKRTQEPINIPNNSIFWEVVTHWSQQGHRLGEIINGFQFCIWDTPPKPLLTHIGGNNYMAVYE